MKRLLAAVAAAALAGGAVSTQLETGCGAKCCQRPEGTPVLFCRRRDPNTGQPADWGTNASMPATHAVGVGCVPAECASGKGIEKP